MLTQVDPFVTVSTQVLFGGSDGVADGQSHAEAKMDRRLASSLRAQDPLGLVTLHHGHIHHLGNVVGSGRLVVLVKNINAIDKIACRTNGYLMHHLE